MIHFDYEPKTFDRESVKFLNEFLVYRALKDFDTTEARKNLAELVRKGQQRALLEHLNGNEQKFGEYELMCLGLRALGNDSASEN